MANSGLFALFQTDMTPSQRSANQANGSASIWPTLAEEHAFSPYKDYLGLAQLVTRISRPEADKPASVSTSSAVAEDILREFRKNGVERDYDLGLMPFMVPVEHRPETMEDRRKGLRSSRLLAAAGKARTCAPTWCVFCKNNGESEMVYASHILKDAEGKITCPILRAYTCPLCGVSGDYSHTIKYCPTTRNEVPPAPLKTARTSTGKKRSLSSMTLALSGAEDRFV